MQKPPEAFFGRLGIRKIAGRLCDLGCPPQMLMDVSRRICERHGYESKADPFVKHQLIYQPETGDVIETTPTNRGEARASLRRGT